MDKALDLLLLLLHIIQFSCICVFIFRYKYIRLSAIFLWGIYLIVDFSLTIIASNYSDNDISGLTSNAFIMLLTNVFLIFALAFILLITRKLKIVNEKILAANFAIFLAIWLIEFYNKSTSENIILNTSEVFEKITIVCICWVYILTTYEKNISNYFNSPALYIVIGWFFYSMTFVLFANPDILNRIAQWLVDFQLLITFIAQIIAYTLYGIGFWKTKQWVLQNQ